MTFDEAKNATIESDESEVERADSMTMSSKELAKSYGVNEGSLLRKIDLYILPTVSVLYLLSFLDRSNVANARIEGLVTDIHITGNQYLTGLTLFFVGYILFEVPCQIVLKKTSPKIWLPTLAVVWGIVATLIGTVTNLGGFFTARFFLGVAEGGLFPGVVYHLSLWYKRSERQFRVALFFSGASLAGAFGGILAYGIAFMNGVGGYAGWRWIFIIEGLATFVIGILSYFLITSYPTTAKFLNDNEYAFLQKRLQNDSDAGNNETFAWSAVKSCLKDPKVYLYCAAYHTMSLPLYTLSLFLPTIIKDLGFTAAKAQLFTIPPYALATILTAVVAFVSERAKKRAPVMMLFSLIGVIGYIILLSNSDLKTVTTVAAGVTTSTVEFRHPWVSYVGTFFAAAGIYPSSALALSLPAVNVSGQTKRACAGGLQITLGNLGAVIGTQIYRTNFGPRFVQGHAVALAYLAANVIVSAVTWWYLTRENRKRDALEKSGTIVVPTGRILSDEDVRFRFTT